MIIEAQKTTAVVHSTADELIVQSLAKLDSMALGIALGAVCGLGVFVATNVLVFKGGAQIGPTLTLLGHYFIGYEVTFAGSFIGLFYGFAFGFSVGWLIAILRNIAISIYLHFIRLTSGLSAVEDFIDHP